MDITTEFMESLLKKTRFEDSQRITYERMNAFVESVITRYSEVYFSEIQEASPRKILPIGFLPSNVLANECLHKFDSAILDGWNPIYYGRYVDDILIVEKVENGKVYTMGGNSKDEVRNKNYSLTNKSIYGYGSIN